MKLESRDIFQMIGKNIYFYKFAGLLGASAVILGAYGAHGKLIFLPINILSFFNSYVYCFFSINVSFTIIIWLLIIKYGMYNT